jgi:hypothetical protein
VPDDVPENDQRKGNLEHPAFADQNPFDRRVPLKCLHCIVEHLGDHALRIPRGIEPELVGRASLFNPSSQMMAS